MKSIRLLLAAAAAAFTVATTQAQSTPKILVIDLAKVFDNHYKTQEQEAKLKADQAKAQEQFDQMQKDGQALVTQFKELDEQTKNPAATAEAKAKAQADAQKLYEQIQQKRNEENSFVQNTRNTIQQRAQSFKALLLEEITKIAVDVAKSHGATILVDRSGQSLASVPVVLYFDPTLDITDEVVAIINKDRPAGLPVATPTPAATTSGTDAPKITVPGIDQK